MRSTARLPGACISSVGGSMSAAGKPSKNLNMRARIAVQILRSCRSCTSAHCFPHAICLKRDCLQCNTESSMRGGRDFRSNLRLGRSTLCGARHLEFAFGMTSDRLSY
eukprot:5600719-Amphidinium_carterae.1